MDLQLREGQIVSVYQKVSDGKRERNVAFIGRIMKVRGSGVNKTITVKQTLEGIEVEKIFPVSSPFITKIEVAAEVKKVRSKPGAKRKISKKSRKTQGTSTKRSTT